jgi:nicotinamide mononucleotide adenylyltransferase
MRDFLTEIRVAILCRGHAFYIKRALTLVVAVVLIQPSTQEPKTKRENNRRALMVEESLEELGAKRS